MLSADNFLLLVHEFLLNWIVRERLKPRCGVINQHIQWPSQVWRLARYLLLQTIAFNFQDGLNISLGQFFDKSRTGQKSSVTACIEEAIFNKRNRHIDFFE